MHNGERKANQLACCEGAQQKAAGELTFHIRQVKPRGVAALDQRLVDPLHRGLRIPLVCIHALFKSQTHL